MAETISETTNPGEVCGIKGVRTVTVIKSCPPVPRGFAAWLPALVVLIGMPLLALAVTKYVLLPSVKEALSSAPTVPGQFDATQEPANLVIARLPLTTPGGAQAHADFKALTLVGADNVLKDEVKQNKAKLTAVAIKSLENVTMAQLDRPGVLDQIRTQLVVDMNHALGTSSVKEVYLTARTQ